MSNGFKHHTVTNIAYLDSSCLNAALKHEIQIQRRKYISKYPNYELLMTGKLYVD
jgi:hypothetical protein